MGLINKETCIICGEKAGALTRGKLADKNYVCFDCYQKYVSELFWFNFLKYYTTENFLRYLDHKKENKKKLEEFNPTDSYFNCVLVDKNKGWFLFEKNITLLRKEEIIERNLEVFEAKDLRYFDLHYSVKDVKEKIFNTNVKADIIFAIAFDNEWYPYAFSGKVAKNEKYAAEITGIINKSVNFEGNDDMTMLSLYLFEILAENGIEIPRFLGGRFTRRIDLEPYRPYLKKMFEMAYYNVDVSLDLDRQLENITPSNAIRKQIKKEFTVKKRR